MIDNKEQIKHQSPHLVNINHFLFDDDIFNRLSSWWTWFLVKINKIMINYNVSPSTGGFFLATAEGCSLHLHQKGPSSQKVILADEGTDKGTNGGTGLRKLDIKHYVNCDSRTNSCQGGFTWTVLKESMS